MPNQVRAPLAPDLDPEQVEAVNLRANAVVAAGAGSGKTTVLARRYLGLVREGAAVGEILTLTFTRKAAAEMYARIYRLLLDHADHQAVRRAVEDFDQAQISTIDSFCARLLAPVAADFGLPFNFSQDEDAVRQLVRRCSFDFLSRQAGNSGLDALYAAHGFVSVWNEGFEKLALRHMSLVSIPDYNGYAAAQKKRLEAELRSKLHCVGEAAALLARIDPAGAKTVKAAVETAAGAARLAEAFDAGDFVAVERELDVWASLQPGRGAAAEASGAKEAIAVGKKAAKEGRPIARGLDRFAAHEGLLGLCGLLHREINAAKRQAGLATFDDVIRLAIEALSKDLELRSYYKRRFRHIMIDEFQDNNDTQRNLLFLLAERPEAASAGLPSAKDLEPGKLFFVGDEKQSIYRFRGADVAVFKGLSSELEEAGGRTIALRRNYRSRTGLVRFFNNFFPKVMGDSREDFEAAYTFFLEPEEGATDDEPVVEFAVGPAPTDDGARISEDDEAAFVAERVAAAVGSGEFDYGDISVLLRSASNQYRFERAFRARGIPYAAGAVRSLFLEAPANDIYAALQLVLYPEDRAAHAVFLRSPFVGLSDSGLIRWLAADESAPLDAADTERAAADRLLEKLRLLSRTLSPAELVSHLWHDVGYRYRILSHPRFHAHLELYDYLYSLAAKDPKMTLAAFLDQLRPRLGRFEKEDEVVVERDEEVGVRIMSIHKAKGLEFPFVILANTGNVGRMDVEGSSPVYQSADYGPCFGFGPKSRGETNHLYELEKEHEKAAGVAELRRILYVGMTRAKHRLVVTGTFNKHNYTKGWETKSLLGLCYSAAGWDPKSPPVEDVELAPASPEGPGSRVRCRRIDSAPILTQPSPGAHETEKLARALARVPVRRVEYPAAAAAVTALTQDAVTEASGRSLPKLAVDDFLDDDGDTYFGTLCHYLIAARLSAAPGSPEITKIPARLFRACPTPARYEVFLSDARRLADRFFGSAFAARFLEVGRAEAEVPFVLRQNSEPRYVHGVMDALVTSRTEVWVVDFKTDRRLAPKTHELQMDYYRRAATALSGLRSRSWLYYLRDGSAVECRDEALDDGGFEDYT